MQRLILLVFVVPVLAFGLSAGQRRAGAAPYIFQTDMVGNQVVPPVNSLGWGFVRFFFSEDRRSADYTVDVKGFSNSIVLGADIHRGAPGTNGPVIHHLADGNFIVIGGHMTFTTADLDDMATGLWYVSLSTTFHPEGEMRGQVTLPADFMPAPPAIVSSPDSPPAVPAFRAPAPSAPEEPVVQIRPPNTGDGGFAGVESDPLTAALVGLSTVILGVGLMFVSGRI